MKSLFKKIIIIFLLNITCAHSEGNIFFIDLDKVIESSIIGKKTLSKIENLNNQNIKNLKIKNDELKKLENEIKIKQNIVSKEEFDRELSGLKTKIKNYRKIKDELARDFGKKKDDYMNNLFTKINPIIQDYMKKNSINILLESKNVFIGKKNLDITDDIIKEVNIKLN